MEPIIVIVTALALGAAAGLKSTATQAVKDAYTGLKALILRNFTVTRATRRRPWKTSKASLILMAGRRRLKKN